MIGGCSRSQASSAQTPCTNRSISSLISSNVSPGRYQTLNSTEQSLGVVPGSPDLFPLYHPAAAMYNQTLKVTLFEDARALHAELVQRAA